MSITYLAVAGLHLAATFATAQPEGFEPSEMPPLRPLRGIAYGALPCRERFCAEQDGWPSPDMMQAGYDQEWGAAGRDDLGVMKALGANLVRMYHELGMDVKEDHGSFLDYAQELALNVMPGYHTEGAVQGKCPNFDCFEAWKAATLEAFDYGFGKDGDWHPAVVGLVLLNEPDFFFNSECGNSCRLRASLSALDGVLAAEREMGVNSSRVRLTVAWSFGMREPIDGTVIGPGIFGFQDMKSGILKPDLAKYTPRSSLLELKEAFRSRWVHCLNTQAPWNFVRDVVGKSYDQFLPTPWFIGEYGANGEPRHLIKSDLVSMEREAEKNEGFLGAAVFQFQTANSKGGSEMNFGIFDLKPMVVGRLDVCEYEKEACDWPLHCLTPSLSFLPGTLGHRAEAVAAAWNGTVNVTRGLC